MYFSAMDLEKPTYQHKKILLHILMWIIFISVQLFLFPKPPHRPGEDSFLIIENVIINLYVIAFFYFNFYYLTTNYYLKKKYPTYFGIVIVGFIIVSIIIHGLKGDMHPPPPPMSPEQFHRPEETGKFAPYYFIGIFLLKFIISWSISSGLRIYASWKDAEKENYKAELAYLKLQINPHFLFNTLNNIYALALMKSDKTADAVQRLSSIMRYVLQGAETPFVAVEDELDYIKDFMALQRLRLPENVQLDFEINGKADNKKIAPLLLMTYIENAMKYGVSTEEDCEIIIHLSVNNKHLEFYAENKKFEDLHHEAQSLGIGIDNAKKRLDLLYSGNYKLNIIDAKDKYITSLILPLL